MLSLVRYLSYWMLFLCFLNQSLAQERKLLPLWDGDPPVCPNSLDIEKTYDERIGYRVSKVSTPALDVYLPPDSLANGTSVIICPGGGYAILAWNWEGTEMAKWYNSFGVTAFVLQYRLPHWEKRNECSDKIALADAQRAIRTVRANAAKWKLDPQRIGMMGFSAGGHLASTAGTHFDAGNPDSEDLIEHQSSRPDFMILMYPVVSMQDGIAHGGSKRNLIGDSPSEQAIQLYSNEEQVSAETPPTLLIHADDDKAVIPENSVHFYLALRKHRVPAAMHIFSGGGHGFSFGKDKGITASWPQLCKGWMDEMGWLVND
ncbi:MAG: alpha/beta hydrolase [Bacteroidota bacterium]